LAVIDFEVLNNSTKTTSPINIDPISLNSGGIPTNVTNGTFTVTTNYSLKGNIRYYSNSKAISNVALDLSGNKSYQSISDGLGSFTLNNIENGVYKLTVSKIDEASSINAYDASLILQSAVGLTTLNANQKIAADADANGKVDALDAS
jgi:hypothetical protein